MIPAELLCGRGGSAYPLDGLNLRRYGGHLASLCSIDLVRWSLEGRVEGRARWREFDRGTVKVL